MSNRYKYKLFNISLSTGNITKSLMREGIYNNTIIVFASDNGANVGFCKDDHLDDDWLALIIRKKKISKRQLLSRKFIGL